MGDYAGSIYRNRFMVRLTVSAYLFLAFLGVIGTVSSALRPGKWPGALLGGIFTCLFIFWILFVVARMSVQVVETGIIARGLTGQKQVAWSDIVRFELGSVRSEAFVRLRGRRPMTLTALGVGPVHLRSTLSESKRLIAELEAIRVDIGSTQLDK